MKTINLFNRNLIIKSILSNSLIIIVLLFLATSCIDTDAINNPSEKTIENLVVSDSFSWTSSKSVVLLLNAISENPELSSKISVYDGNPKNDGKLLLNCGVTETSAFEGELQVLVSQEYLFFECEFPNGTFMFDSVLIIENNTIEHTFKEVIMSNQSALAVVDGPDCSEGCDETITQENGNFTIKSGNTYCLTSNFSGNITFQGTGGILRICGTTTIYNLNINGNPSVSIQVSESGSLNVSNLNLNNDAVLSNWGTLNYSGNFSLLGTLNNYGTANISGLNINSGGELLNEGQMNISGHFNSSSEVSNNGAMFVAGHFNNDGGSTLLNNCKIVVSGNFYQNSTFENYGYLYTGGAFTINGGSNTNLYNQAMLNISSFMLNDNINGDGEYSSISVAGNTNINGGGSITGAIDICDENGIETNNGTIAESVSYCENYIPVSNCNPVGVGTEPLNDADGDGVTNTQDEFPNDPSLAFRSYLAGENTSATLLFEDLWPAKGDYDFNDFVAGIEGVYYTNSKNKVVQLNLTIDVKAIGASNKNGLGLQFDALVPNAISSVAGNILKTTDSGIVENSNGTEANQDAAVVILIENVNDVIHRVGGATFNTLSDGRVGESDLVEVQISFENNPLSMEDVSLGKLNFFLIKNQNRSIEIHLADFKPSNLMKHEFGDLADTSSPANDRYYKTQHNLPWGLFILDEVSYPLEKTSVTEAFTNFYDWAASNGTTNNNWYRYPNILSVWNAE